MFEKIKSSSKHPFIRQFRDVRAVGLAVFGVITLMVTWSGVKAVQTNYGLQKRISSMQQQNAVTALQNNNLKLQNQYLNTDQFLELTARREFGLAAPGEQILIVPTSVALAHAPSLTTNQAVKAAAVVINKPIYQRNFEHWINFFLHRSSTE